MANTKITSAVIEAGAILNTHIASGAISSGHLSGINTSAVAEGTNLYYTDPRARASISVTGGNLAYDSSTGVLQLTDNDIRDAISAGGNLSYNNSTGVMSYTTPTMYSDADAQGAISVTNASGDGSLAYSGGTITYTGPSAAETQAHFSAGTDIAYSAGQISVSTTTASGGTNTTALATTAFVQQEITTLIGGAPSTLNDLNELANAINDDANYNSTLTTALATKLPLAGGTLTGALGGTTATFTPSTGENVVITRDSAGPYIGTSTNHSLRIITNNAKRINITSGGDISFGTTDKLFWDASGESLSIGTTGSGTDRRFQISSTNPSTATTQYGIVANPTMSNDVTGSIYNIYSQANVASGASLANLYSVYIGASGLNSSTVTDNYGLYQAGASEKNYFAGNVGIGTSTPQSKLDVKLGNNETASIGGTISSGTYAGLRFGYSEAGNTNYRHSAIVFERDDAAFGDARGNIHILNSPSGSASADLGDARLTILPAGNVGIGDTNPAEKLVVKDGNIKLKSNADGNTGILMLYDAAGTQSGQVYPSAGDLRIWSPNDVLILPTGNVGIGTNNPGGKLHVQTSHTATDVTLANSNETLVLGNSGTGNGVYNAIKFGGNQQDMYIMSFNYNQSYDRRMGFFLGSVAGDAVADERLSILGNGNVGIGTNTPDLKLDVSHGTTTEYVATFQNTADNLELKIGTTTGALLNIQGQVISSSAPYNIGLQADGGGVGIGTPTPGNTLVVKAQSGSNKGIELAHANGYKVAELVHHGSGSEGRLSLYDTGTETVRLHGESGQHTFINSGNVGIGTATPNYKLEVGGHTGVRNGSFFIGTETGSNTGGIEFYVPVADPNTLRIYRNVGAFGGTYSAQYPSLELYSGSTYATRITGYGNSYFTAGNVGIGTATPDTKLQVSGDISTAVDGNAYQLYYTAARDFITNNGATAIIKQIDDDATNAFIDFKSWTNSSLMRLMNSGNLAIGGHSPEPTIKLDINSGAMHTVSRFRFSDDNNGASNNILAHEYFAGIEIENVYSGAAPSANGTKIAKLSLTTVTAGGYGAGGSIHTEATSNSYDAGELVFSTGSNSSGNNTERMRIGRTGDVGIGTSVVTSPGLWYDANPGYLAISHWATPPTPAAMLHLSDNSNDLDVPQIRIEGRESPGDTVLDISVKDAGVRLNLIEGPAGDANNGYGLMEFKTNAAVNTAYPTRGGFKFSTPASSSNLVITNTGDVGIGTSSISARLHVSGAATPGNFAAIIQNSSGGGNVLKLYNHDWDDNDHLLQATNGGTGANGYAFTVDGQSKVGIGTADPAAGFGLEIKGTGAYNADIKLNRGLSGAGHHGINWYNGTTKKAEISWGENDANFKIRNFRNDNSTSYARIDFDVGGSSYTTNPETRMVIQNTGDVGIGQTIIPDMTNTGITLAVMGPVLSGKAQGFAISASADDAQNTRDWFNFCGPGTNSSGNYVHMKTDLDAGGTASGNIEYTMSNFTYRGYYAYGGGYGSGSIGWHNWSGTYYNVQEINDHTLQLVQASYTSSDGKVVLVALVGGGYAQFSIDWQQWAGYPFRARKVTAVSMTTSATGAY
jgi:hypothetical protein